MTGPGDPGSPSPSPDLEALPPAAPAEPTPEGFEEQHLRAFVGQKADYYLKQWAGLRRETGQNPGFNWAAFFLSGLWLPYRKMYRTTAIFYGGLLALSIAEEVVFIGILGRAEVPSALNFVGLAIGLICGTNGNRWYLAHAQKTIAEARDRGLDPYAVSAFAADRGGTSLGASVGLFLLFLFFTVGVTLLLDPYLYPT